MKPGVSEQLSLCEVIAITASQIATGTNRFDKHLKIVHLGFFDNGFIARVFVQHWLQSVFQAVSFEWFAVWRSLPSKLWLSGTKGLVR